MRLDVKFRILCLAGAGIVAAVAAGEALAKGGGRSVGGRWIGGDRHVQHLGGGVHGGRVAHGGGRRTADFAGYWRRGHGSGGGYWGGYYGGGGVYYDDAGIYGDYGPDGPPAYGGAPIYAPTYYPAPGYQAPTVVYPPSAYQSYAPVASHGSDPHIIHVHAARRHRPRKS